MTTEIYPSLNDRRQIKSIINMCFLRITTAMEKNCLKLLCFFVLSSSFLSAKGHEFEINTSSPTTKQRNQNVIAFPACSTYKNIEMQEEKPPNTFVMQVHAVHQNRGEITYSLIENSRSQRRLLKIDHRTGVIRTIQKIDHDAPFHEENIHLSVEARDPNGTSTVGSCNFTIEIIDINDNPPIFEPKVDERISILKNFKVGDICKELKTTDVDEGENAIVRYSFLPIWQNDSQYFRIDKWTGKIYLSKVIDKREGYHFLLTARAEDLNNPDLYSLKSLEFIVNMFQ